MHPSDAVRQAVPSDIDELVRLRHSMFRAMAVSGAAGRPDEVEESSWYPAATAALLDQMERTVLAAFVVEAPGVPARDAGPRPLAACAVVTIYDRLPGPGFPRGIGGSMSSVFVVPAHRGRGLARAVVSAGLSWLHDQGVEVIDLHATPQAEPLYRSLGFKPARSLALRRLRQH